MLTILMGLGDPFEISNLLRWVKIGVIFTFFLQYIYYFLWVILNIRFYHNYEFKRIRNTLLAQISFVMLEAFESLYLVIILICTGTNPF